MITVVLFTLHSIYEEIRFFLKSKSDATLKNFCYLKSVIGFNPWVESWIKSTKTDGIYIEQEKFKGTNPHKSLLNSASSTVKKSLVTMY